MQEANSPKRLGPVRLSVHALSLFWLPNAIPGIYQTL